MMFQVDEHTLRWTLREDGSDIVEISQGELIKFAHAVFAMGIEAGKAWDLNPSQGVGTGLDGIRSLLVVRDRDTAIIYKLRKE